MPQSQIKAREAPADVRAPGTDLHERVLHGRQSGIVFQTSKCRELAETCAYQGLLAHRASGDVALLLGELNHRIRNLLAVIQAVVRQTLATDIEDCRAKLIARIRSLRGVYEMSEKEHDREIGLGELLERTMRPHCANGCRVLARGPDVDLNPDLAYALHLVFHELAHNATKYGALSTSFGTVVIRWTVGQLPGASRSLAILWTEHGGPKVKPPSQFGFGSRLIVKAIEPHGEARLEFRPTGLVCALRIALDRVGAAATHPPCSTQRADLAGRTRPRLRIIRRLHASG